jgi:hypothetical protein
MTVEITRKQKTVEVTKKVTDIINVAQPGAAGPPNELTIGTVTIGEPSVTITGIPPNQVIDFVLPATARHVHTQSTAASTWVINHALGGYPSVSVVDSSRTLVFGEITYPSTSQVVVNYSAAFSGYAFLT